MLSTMNAFVKCLLPVLIFLCVSPLSVAQSKATDASQRRSMHHRRLPSVPRPFTYGVANPDTLPAISTGYYIVDSDDGIQSEKRPEPSAYIDTLIEPGTWKRIVSGPNQIPSTYWHDPERNVYGGFAFLHNPGAMSDSTDNAFAGPIAIGFPFFMNGVRYDSFYVSTNGLIALSNRRYHYVTDPFGWKLRRDVQQGTRSTLSVYDDESDDPRSRTASQGDTADPVADDWGYRYVACGGDPLHTRGGIRAPRNTMLSDSALRGLWSFDGQSLPSRPAVIAACWDDWQVSVYDSARQRRDDFGRIYFKRSPAGDNLVIAFFNLTPVGPKVARLGPVMASRTFRRDNRPGQDGHYSVNVQVHLNRRDSSITIHFGEINGSVRSDGRAIVAAEWVRSNATIGVYGQARRMQRREDTTSLTYASPSYEQSTEYLYNDQTDSLGSVRVGTSDTELSRTPHAYLAIAMKQWRNRLRVVSSSYNVIERSRDSSSSFSRHVPSDSCAGFEMLSGDNRLDGVVPVVVVQTLANDIQGKRGVNTSRSDEPFRVRVRFVHHDGRIRYNASRIVTRAMFVDQASGVQLCDAHGTIIPVDTAWPGLKPYDYIRVTFQPFVWIAAPDGEVGTFTMQAAIDARDTVGQPIGEDWPLDDTLTNSVVRMSRWYQSGTWAFADGFTAFNLSNTMPSPVIYRWVGRGVDVVDGVDLTMHPMEPSGEARAENNLLYVLRAPVLRLDRLDQDGREIPRPGTYGGDELRSVPIDLSRASKAALSFSYQRAGRLTSRSRGYADQTLTGPEHRVLARDVTQTEPFERKPDELIVEFAKPSDDGVNGITNILDWRFDPAGLDSLYTPAYRIFGGGGYIRGFDSTDHSRQLDRTAAPGTGGLYPDLDDDGKDEEWRRVYIPIPDTILRWRNDGNRSFRFRLRASCMNNAGTADVVDDNDPFYVDNVALLTDIHGEADLHLMDVRMHWPYTMTPRRQLVRIPVSVMLANNAPVRARNARVDVLIRDRFDTTVIAYRHTLRLDSVAAGECRRHAMPPVDLSPYSVAEWELLATVQAETPDQVPFNDTVRGQRRLVTGHAFAYEANPEIGVNDVPTFSGVIGKGLSGSLHGSTNDGRTFWYAGQGTMPSQYEPNVTWRFGMPEAISDAERFGDDAGSGTGAVAMQFSLVRQDTLYGYQAWWGGLNSTGVARYAIHQDLNGRIADVPVPGTSVVRPRGADDLSTTMEPVFNAYATVLLDSAVVLDSGTYWLSVEQLGFDGFHLGASASRSGAIVTAITDRPGQRVTASHAWIDNALNTRAELGRSDHVSRFAVRNAEGAWQSSMPRHGRVPYAQHTATGSIDYVMTWTQGSWIPLLRPVLERRQTPIVRSVQASDASGMSLNSDVITGRSTHDPDAADRSVGTLHLVPNPTNGSFALMYPGRADRIRIMDIRGVAIRDVDVRGQQHVHAETWYGSVTLGAALPAGGYLVAVDGSLGVVTAVVTLIR